MRTLLLACALLSASVGVVWSPRASAATGAGPCGPPAQADVGFLDVASDPPAKILIDDADTGKATPQPHLELKKGHHKLTLVTLDGAHRRSVGFTIEPGQTTKLTIHLAS